MKNTTKRTILKSLAGLALIGMMNGCGAIDSITEEFSDGEIVNAHGIVYFADNSKAWGETSNTMSIEDNGYVLYDDEVEFRVGWISQGGTVLDVNGDYVGECIANESEPEYELNSFTEDGWLQGTCHLDREVGTPVMGEPYKG